MIGIDESRGRTKVTKLSDHEIPADHEVMCDFTLHSKVNMHSGRAGQDLSVH